MLPHILYSINALFLVKETFLLRKQELWVKHLRQKDSFQGPSGCLSIYSPKLLTPWLSENLYSELSITRVNERRPIPRKQTRKFSLHYHQVIVLHISLKPHLIVKRSVGIMGDIATYALPESHKDVGVPGNCIS